MASATARRHDASTKDKSGKPDDRASRRAN